MPKTSAKKLAYQAEYQNTPDQIKRREARNRARYAALKAGTAKKGDGKDVAHIIPLDDGGLTNPKNLKVESAKKNRGWRRGESSYNVKKDK